MLLQLHDELLLEVPETEMPATAKTVRRVMEDAVRLSLPLTVDLKMGKNWGEMYPMNKIRIFGI
jgi:DNA polymerase-1